MSSPLPELDRLHEIVLQIQSTFIKYLQTSPRAILGHILFGRLQTPKSEKTVKSPYGFSEKFANGRSLV